MVLQFFFVALVILKFFKKNAFPKTVINYRIQFFFKVAAVFASSILIGLKDSENRWCSPQKLLLLYTGLSKHRWG
jgi:hypothetical protein